jgi:hypothetical protein
MVIAGSGNDLLKGGNQVVADIEAVGPAPSHVDRNAERRGRIVQSVQSGATVVGIVSRVRRSHDMVVAIVAVGRVLARSV